MPIFLRYLLAFACVLGTTAIARADLIFSQSFQEGPNGMNGVFTSARAIVEFTTDNSWGPFPVAPLFDRTVTLADVGKTFTADSSTPFFAQNVALATDGVNNRVGFSVLVGGAGGGSLAYEAEYFYGAPHSPFFIGKADLKGFTITRATLHIDQLTFATSGLNLSNDGNWTDWTFKGTVTFEGTGSVEGMPGELHEPAGGVPQNTPEPASCCLAILGALGIFVYRSRK